MTALGVTDLVGDDAGERFRVERRDDPVGQTEEPAERQRTHQHRVHRAVARRQHQHAGRAETEHRGRSPQVRPDRFGQRAHDPERDPEPARQCDRGRGEEQQGAEHGAR